MSRSLSISVHQQVWERQTCHRLAEGSENRDQECKASFGATESLHASLGAYKVSWMNFSLPSVPETVTSCFVTVTAVACLDHLADPHMLPAGLGQTNSKCRARPGHFSGKWILSSHYPVPSERMWGITSGTVSPMRT